MEEIINVDFDFYDTHPNQYFSMKTYLNSNL